MSASPSEGEEWRVAKSERCWPWWGGLLFCGGEEGVGGDEGVGLVRREEVRVADGAVSVAGVSQKM